MRSWKDFRAKLRLDDNKNFYCHRAWQEMLLECGNTISDLVIKEHHLIKKHQIYCLEKLNI